MTLFISSRGLMATIAAAATFAAAPLVAQTIEQPSNDAPLLGFGNPSELYVPTVGQSFVSLGSTLNSFSFWLVNEASIGSPENTPNAEQLEFTAYIALWNGTHIEAPLYSSNLQAGPGQLSQRYTFNTGGLSVINGASYMAFLTVPDLIGDISAGVEQSDNASSAGEAWFAFTNDLDLLGSSDDPQWQDLGGQLRFEATFSPSATVPEPASATLLVGALAGLLFVARRRRVHS